MRLPIEKLAALGWNPSLQSEKAVPKATEQLAEEIE
jgi:hypothetical protein